MECLNLQQRESSNGLPVSMRCGQCEACLIQRQASWTARMLLERSQSGSSRFWTLTFRPETLPLRFTAKPFQLFMKRLRKSFPWRIRYFSCGELGERRERPHFHAVFFTHGRPVPQILVEEAWGNGFVKESPGECVTKQLRYVTKYMVKAPEDSFTLMSRDPGIGLPAMRGLGRLAAAQVLPSAMPPWLTISGKTYPLDSSMKAAYKAGYERSGRKLLVEDDTSRLNDWLARVLERVDGSEETNKTIH